MQEELMELALKRNFLMPSNEIYGHTAGFYDYGVVGAAMKRKLENAWRELFLWREGFYEIESASVLPEKVLKASGHVDNFFDEIVECRKCGVAQKVEAGKEELKCQKCGSKLDAADAKRFYLMFETRVGGAKENVAYLRPETAQGIFVDFPRVFRALGAKLPLGVGQIGKSFRNEIAPRQALMRLREFTQMELEYFFNPGEAKHAHFKEVAGKRVRVMSAEAQGKGQREVREYSCSELVEQKIVPNEIVAYFMLRTAEFYEAVGLKREKFWFRQLLQNEMPHYSKGNYDVEVETSYGVVELMGLAYRTDFDLAGHAKMSSQDLSVHLEGVGRVMPHVVEPSFGVDRLFWALMEQSYRKSDTTAGGVERGGAPSRDWAWFDFPPIVAPFDACIYPLMKKDGLDEAAGAVARELRHEGMSVYYDESGSIGKRYARADEIGVPYCVTVDYESLKSKDVTIRYRNDGKQERVPIKGLGERVRQLILDGKTSL